MSKPTSEVEPLIAHPPQDSDCPPRYRDVSSESFSSTVPRIIGEDSILGSTNRSLKASQQPPEFDTLEAGLEEAAADDRPPDFSIYRASYTTTSVGNVTSHDAHLNSDGEALCRFILLQISTPPGLFVKLSGTHEDVRLETISEIVHGRTEYRTTERRQTVTDFSFTVSLPSDESLEHGIRRLYIVSDGEVVGRGGHWREAGRWETGQDLRLLHETNSFAFREGDLLEKGTTRVRCKQRRRADKIAKQVKAHGYPPFVPPWMFPPLTFSVDPARPPDELLGENWEHDCSTVYHSLVDQGYYVHTTPPRDQIFRVEQELRRWCDEYCGSNKGLKEFKVEKNVFGWDLAALEKELLHFLQTRPHLSSTHFSVDFQTTSSRIVVRPVHIISKVFSLSGFYKFMLTITLIYPILWLVRYLILGVEYNVVRVAYPLVYWDVVQEADGPSGTNQIYQNRVLKGQTEREWFNFNQQRIADACQAGKIGPLSDRIA